MPFLLITLLVLGVLAYFVLSSKPTQAKDDVAPKQEELDLPDFPHQLIPEEGDMPAVAIVQRFPALSEEKIVASLQKQWPEIGPFSVTTEADGTRVVRANKLLFRYLLAGPVSDSEQYIKALQNSAIWPTAADEVARHDAALLVSVEGAPSGLRYVSLLTCAVGALVDSCPQIKAAWWPMANHVIPRVKALKGYTNLKKERPIELWVATNVFTEDDGAVSGYTHGLRSLGVDEFEAIRCPETQTALRDRLSSLAVYSALTCNAIFNGDTTGVDEFERITLKKKPSQTVHKGWVFHLHY
jgi:hypothetical protein